MAPPIGACVVLHPPRISAAKVIETSGLAANARLHAFLYIKFLPKIQMIALTNLSLLKGEHFELSQEAQSELFVGHTHQVRCHQMGRKCENMFGSLEIINPLSESALFSA